MVRSSFSVSYLPGGEDPSIWGIAIEEGLNPEKKNSLRPFGHSISRLTNIENWNTGSEVIAVSYVLVLKCLALVSGTNLGEFEGRAF